MESEGFRIKLNLSEFFTDRRKYSYIFIELLEINDFYDLERRIRHIFSINENIIFLIDNVFVPHSENIKLIHEEETLTLVAETIGLDKFGVNTYSRTRKTKNSQISNERKQKKKKLLCQEGCQACLNYFKTKSCHVLSPEMKRKKLQSLNQCNFSKLNCNFSQNESYPYMESDTIMPNTETIEIQGTENEMFLRVNKVYDFGRNKHEGLSENPVPNTKKVRFKNVKKVENNEERPIVLDDETINNETENNSINNYSQITSNATGNFYFHKSDYIMEKEERNRKLSTYDINKTDIKNNLQTHNRENGMYPIEIGGGDHSKEYKTEHRMTDIKRKPASKEILCFDDTKSGEKELIKVIKPKTDTSFLGNQNKGKKSDLSEDCENINNTEISASVERCNHLVSNVQINDLPISMTGNVENCRINRQRTRVRTRKRKQQATSESPNITGLPPQINGFNTEKSCISFEDETSSVKENITGLPPQINGFNTEKSCISFEDETSSVKENLMKNQEDNSFNQNCVNVEAGDNYSTHMGEFYSPLPTKSEAFLARIKSPNPVDVFRTLLSPPVVLNQTSSNSKTLQRVTLVDEEQPLLIDCEDDDCIDLEKYPLINSSPRKGDILAFKINRVAPDGTPHITEYIVAEVLKFCDMTSQITVIVQCGLDQLKEPQDRFENVEDSCNECDTYEFNWNELLETRLLFP